MSDVNVPIVDQPIIDDSITSDDAGFSSNAGDQVISEPSASEPQIQSESKEEFKDEVEEAIENGASEEQIKQMIKEFTIKVNGKEVKKKIDLSDEQAIKKELQLSAAGQAAMQRAKELEKTYEQEIKRLLENPWEVLQELGLDADGLAEQRIRSKVEELKKSPEQLEKEKMQKELEQARAELKKQKEDAERARFLQLQDQEASKLEEEIQSVLDSHKTLPKSQKTVSRIADAMLWAMDNGFKDVTVKDVIPTVEAEIKKELNGFMSEMPEELLETYIGKRNLERLRKTRLNKLKANNINNIKPTTSSVQKSEEKTADRVRMKNYFKTLK